MKAGESIKMARIQKGITQEELASKTNINIRTIQRIENGEVTARAHSLRMIAGVLDIDLSPATEEQPLHGIKETENKALLIYLHLSGLLLLPAVLIWYFEKDQVKGVKQHGIDVINFQLSMLAILIPFLLLPGFPILIALFTIIVVLINSAKVMLNKPYHYPLTISFLKKENTFSTSA
jgi:transcriptional regulator with XRE-family HTH domain